jgi:hypothetical protein
MAAIIIGTINKKHYNNNGRFLYSALIFTNVSMRFTTSGGLFRAAYYGALAAEQLTIMRN